MRAPHQHGMTLVEVSVALAIFALTAAMVLELLSASIRRAQRSAIRQEVLLEAQSLMSEYLSGKDFVGTPQSGETALGHRWQLRTTPLTASAPAASWQAYELTVRVEPTNAPTLATELATIALSPSP